MANLAVTVCLLVTLFYFVDCLTQKQHTIIKGRGISKRLAPLKNVSAPPYIIDDNNPINRTIREITDYTCGKSKLCEKSNGFFIYTARCYKCDDCRCDSACHVYGDCCNDKFDQTHPSFLTCEEKLDNRNRRHKQELGVLMVSRCPKHFINVSTRIVNNCENPDVYDKDQARPVWAASSGLTFKNKFCAVCHQEDNFEPWGLEATCSSSDVFYGVKSQPDVWKVVLDSDNCTITSNAPEASELRQCRLNVIDTCPVSFALKNVTVARLCESLTSVVFFKFVWYKNVFCAICNGASVARREECNYPQIHRGPDPVPPLSVLLKFYPDKSERPQDHAQCPPSSVFNPVLGNCSSVLCPQRYIYIGGICKPVFQSAVGLGYKISLTLLSAKPVRVSTTGYIRRKYLTWLRERLQRYTPYVTTRLDVTVRGKRVLNPNRHVIVTSLQVSFQIVSTRNVTMDIIETDLKTFRRESWMFSSRDKEDIEFVSTFQRPHSEFLAQDTDRGEIVNRVSSSDNTSVFGRRCLKEDCLRNVEFLDISDNLNCAHVDFELTVLGNFNITMHGSSLTKHNRTVQLEHGTFKTFGGKIEICTSQLEHLKELFKGREIDVVEWSLWLSILSTVCLSLSCVFLFLTFVIYLLVPELQTLPGRNTMALVLFLFLAQIFYLSGVQATDNENLCKALGIIIHYLWLAAFFWMFICAFHMHSIFTNLCSSAPSPMKSRLERKQFEQYILLACLGPVVFVGGCIGYSMARTDGANIGYGGNLCFINSIDAKGIFLAAPLLLMLIFNVFFYIRTVLAIRRMPDLVAHNKSNRNYVAIYFRLAVLLGLGWIFGFMPFDFLRVIFVILTGGQGVFIFFTVCATGSVVKSLRRKIPYCVHFLYPKSVFYTRTGSTEMSSKDNNDFN